MLKIIPLILLIFSFKTLANQPETYKELTAALENIRLDSNVPSMAVAIISKGKVTYSKGFGYVDQNQTQPATDKSLYRIASISKLFTAQAIMQLVEDDKLSLDDKVSKHLHIISDDDITIRQLLTHSSGISDAVRPVSFDKKRSQHSYFQLVNQSIKSNTGSKSFAYSDTNFNLLGGVVSAISGVSYEQYINDNILKPASMAKSNFFNGSNNYFAETSPTYKGKVLAKIDRRPYDVSFNPSEGLVSNVSDLAKWLQLVVANDGSLLKPSSYQAMLEPQVKTTWGEIYIALGWQVYKNDYGNVARHPGSVRGYKSLVLSYPESKNALILLSNSSDTPRWDIAKSITQILKTHGVW